MTMGHDVMTPLGRQVTPVRFAKSLGSEATRGWPLLRSANAPTLQAYDQGWTYARVRPCGRGGDGGGRASRRRAATRSRRGTRLHPSQARLGLQVEGRRRRTRRCWLTSAM